MYNFSRARGYPHPNVTWRREDGSEIIIKDHSGTKQLGKYQFKKTFVVTSLH